jgi:sec-independent protein translocase protein TatC
MALVPFPNKAQKPDPDDELDPETDEEGSGGGKMSFLEHLDELRKRIIYSLLAVVIGFGIACFFLNPLFAFITKPMIAALPAGQKLVFTEPTEALMLYLKMAVLAGLLIASPGVMSQVWLFVAPGLYTNEKKLAIPFVCLDRSSSSRAQRSRTTSCFRSPGNSFRALRATRCSSCLASSRRSASTSS